MGFLENFKNFGSLASLIQCGEGLLLVAGPFFGILSAGDFERSLIGDGMAILVSLACILVLGLVSGIRVM